MINITFDELDMTGFLLDRGYTLVTEKRTMSISTYHNNTETFEQDVLVVYKDGKDVFGRVMFNNYPRDYILKEVFIKEMKEALLDL